MKNIENDTFFLDKPIWFQTKKDDNSGVSWTDTDGFVYDAIERLPEDKDKKRITFQKVTLEWGKEKKLKLPKTKTKQPEEKKEIQIDTLDKIFKILSNKTQKKLNEQAKQNIFFMGFPKSKIIPPLILKQEERRILKILEEELGFPFEEEKIKTKEAEFFKKAIEIRNIKLQGPIQFGLEEDSRKKR